ncbi:MAG: hypothetical protein KKE82_00890, partial [Proteobacteria bacterium]|nr:hypothetical protein [Pseudomonadota bacterium]
HRTAPLLGSEKCRVKSEKVNTQAQSAVCVTKKLPVAALAKVLFVVRQAHHERKMSMILR